MSEYRSHFRESEFACKCCGKGTIETNLWEKLEAARNIAGIPFVITSGYRCGKRQIELVEQGLSTPTSSHPKGLAVDIKIDDDASRWKILTALIRAGFKRIGVASNFVHADIDKEKTQHRIWFYGR